jgi:putative phosphoribosyl transferase
VRRFRDRADAGRALAAEVAERWRDEPLVVLGLPRGGVPVAAEVAAALQAPLDVFVVRKLGAPGQRELAIGAIATGGVRVLNEDLVRRLGVTRETVEEITREELEELHRRETQYRGERGAVELAGRTVVLVDDGLATGATVMAAVEAVRAAGPLRVVVAVPVGSPEACARVAAAADEVVCLHAPRGFGAVGAYYDDFGQTTDSEVRQLLHLGHDS